VEHWKNVQLLLGHKSRKTTEEYYVAVTKKRMEKAIEARRRTWDADTVELPSLPAMRYLRVASASRRRMTSAASGSWPVTFCHSRAKILTGIVKVR